MKIKICGLRRKEDILNTNELDIDYVGFIFAPSKRYIEPSKAHELIQLSNKITVGVFVNKPMNELLEIVKISGIDIIQLHGDETIDYVNELREYTDQQIWKAIRVKDETSLKDMNQYHVDLYILDAFSKDQYGGLGKTFNWQLLKGIDLNRVLIAGGVDTNNVKEIMNYHPYGIDVSSSVETDGYKDINKIKQLLEVINYG